MISAVLLASQASPAPMALAFEVATKGFVILALALGLVGILRRASAALRHLVLVCAFASLFTLPLVMATFPSLALLPRWLVHPQAPSGVFTHAPANERPEVLLRTVSPSSAQ